MLLLLIWLNAGISTYLQLIGVSEKSLRVPNSSFDSALTDIFLVFSKEIDLPSRVLDKSRSEISEKGNINFEHVKQYHVNVVDCIFL